MDFATATARRARVFLHGVEEGWWYPVDFSDLAHPFIDAVHDQLFDAAPGTPPPSVETPASPVEKTSDGVTALAGNTPTGKPNPKPQSWTVYLNGVSPLVTLSTPLRSTNGM